MSGRNHSTCDDTAGAELVKQGQTGNSTADKRPGPQGWAGSVAAGQSGQAEQQGRQGILRDGFSMPEADYRLIAEIRAACIQHGVLPTKSGILRAGLRALNRMEPQELMQLIKGLEPVKTGRPAKKP